MVGLAVILALVFGVATSAMGANGNPFLLGKKNVASAISTLVKQGKGPALKLQVGAGQPPLAVNSQTRVANLNAARAGRADSAALADSATNAQNADKLDGKDSSEFASSYKRTVVVRPGGTDAQNGTALLDALSSITDASVTKPYLLYIEPGTYDLGTSALQMKQHVDIQGAGELKTLISSSVIGPVGETYCGTGTVRGANNAELKFLTVRHAGTGGCHWHLQRLCLSSSHPRESRELSRNGRPPHRCVKSLFQPHDDQRHRYGFFGREW